MHTHEKHTLEDEWKNLRGQGFFRIVLSSKENIFELSEEVPQKIAPNEVRVLVDRLIWKASDDAFRSLANHRLGTRHDGFLIRADNA